MTQDLVAILPEIWRLPMRSALEGVDHTGEIDYCLRNGLAAIGWGPVNPRPSTPKECLDRVEATSGWERPARHTVARFIDAPEGGLVWTMHTDGTYRVGELRGPWRYNGDPDGQRFDCYQIRDALWADRPLLASEVPGAVIRMFSRRGSSFCQIHDRSARLYSHQLFDRLLDRPQRVPPFARAAVLKDLLDPFDVEDLVYAYLQGEHGYLALPASRRTDTAAYEYVLVHPETGEQAIAQVKTGETAVDLRRLASAAGQDHTAFAYSTHGLYHGDDDDILILSDEQLLEFAEARPRLVPPRVRSWFERTAETGA